MLQLRWGEQTMQMNIYVPRDKESVVAELERAAARSGRPKNEIVLEAIENYLVEASQSIELDSFCLGKVKVISRKELYGRS
jgi:predicted DNA-binding protein